MPPRDSSPTDEVEAHSREFTQSRRRESTAVGEGLERLTWPKRSQLRLSGASLLETQVSVHPHQGVEGPPKLAKA